MLFQYTLFIFLSATSAVASLALGTYNDGVQQVPIGDDFEEQETLTFTFTTTRTRLEFESHTKTMTREYVATATAQPTARAQPTPAIRNFPLAAKMLQAKERQDTCDETACAVCTWYYQCDRGTPEWYVDDYFLRKFEQSQLIQPPASNATPSHTVNAASLESISPATESHAT